jgi:glutathione peroxidase-family protein
MSLLSTARMYLRRTSKLDQPTDIYDHRVTLLDGGELDLASLRGHPTLIVNTASKCGFTPQYEGLQKLYDTYHDRGLRVLGSPSADFADQEFEDAEEIGEFCQKNYGVSFPLTERTSVRADRRRCGQTSRVSPIRGRRRGTSPSTSSAPTAS